MTTIPFRPRAHRHCAALVRAVVLMSLAALLGWSISAHCQEQCALTMHAAVRPSMSISVSPDFLEWDNLRPGVNVLDKAVSVTMRSNVNYTAAVSCDSPYLRDPSAGGASLKHPMEWKSGNGDFQPLSLAPATIRNGGPDIDRTYDELISFRQTLEYSDLPLENPGAQYTMTIWFDIEPRL